MMEIVYGIATIVVALLIFIGPILLIALLARPSMLSKFTKKSWSRKRIAGVGTSSGIAAIMVFSGIGAASEPASVRMEREAREQRQASAKLAEEKRKADALKPIVKKETKTEAIEFETIRQDDASLPKGETKTSVTGLKGERTIAYEVTYVQGLETARKIVADSITTPAVNEVILVGTYIAPAANKPAVKYAAPAPTPAPSASAYYANCTEARSAGAAPIYQGQPGYRPALDRDKDGIACE